MGHIMLGHAEHFGYSRLCETLRKVPTNGDAHQELLELLWQELVLRYWLRASRLTAAALADANPNGTTHDLITVGLMVRCKEWRSSLTGLVAFYGPDKTRKLAGFLLRCTAARPR
jgi:hypothetical protein